MVYIEHCVHVLRYLLEPRSPYALDPAFVRFLQKVGSVYVRIDLN